MARAEMQLGLHTLEQQTLPSAEPYTAYWSQTYPNALRPLKAVTPEMRQRMLHVGRFVAHVTETVVQGTELDGLDEFADLLPHRTNTFASTILSWSRSLGNFNSLHDGQSDLLKAAGILLATNITGHRDFSADTAPKSTYESFVSVWEDKVAERQRPSNTLLSTAQLVGQAAWIEQDPQRRDKLFGIAAKMYGRIYNDPKVPWTRTKFLSGEYLTDIKFHYLGERLRLARKKGDRAAQRELVGEGRALMSNSAQDLKRLYREYERTKDPGSLGWIAGSMFEQFVPLALRESVLTNYSFGKPTEQFEVRRAFTSEDIQPDGMSLRPKPSFDIVVQRYIGGLIAATPVQLKLASTQKGNDRRGEAQYLPNIVYVRVTDLRPSDMSAVADALINYRKQTKPQTTSEIKPFRMLQGRLGPLLEVA